VIEVAAAETTFARPRRPLFELDDSRIAMAPPEARGERRDDVAMLVARRGANRISHERFSSLPAELEPGDLVVVNTSATVPAALGARRRDGMPVNLHLSTRLPAGLWTVEVRARAGAGTHPLPHRIDAEELALPAGARADLLAPYVSGHRGARLWVASLRLPLPVMEYLLRYGAPIRYGARSRRWGIAFYQTVYATELGSVEMPSAGRPFTHELITSLVARGIGVAPVILHTGVSSLEAGERPYEEYYSVPRATANLVNAVRGAGGRVIAVGTTTVRALETTADELGVVHPGSGWTDVVITPGRSVRAVDGLLTGWHEPQASHLDLVGAIAGRQLLERSYRAALERDYMWHEFGDSHLILP
jgi:S-adenosylmethionine:tRNA ribosyltransferase-isomerase